MQLSKGLYADERGMQAQMLDTDFLLIWGLCQRGCRPREERNIQMAILHLFMAAHRDLVVTRAFWHSLLALRLGAEHGGGI